MRGHVRTHPGDGARDVFLRGRIVAVVEAGMTPVQAAPELLGLKTTQVKFSDPSRPRTNCT